MKWVNDYGDLKEIMRERHEYIWVIIRKFLGNI